MCERSVARNEVKEYNINIAVLKFWMGNVSVKYLSLNYFFQAFGKVEDFKTMK